MTESLKEKTAKGLFWGAVNSGTIQMLNLVFGIVLAKQLSPGDYGVVGVLTIFTLIAGNLQSSGFTQGLTNIKNPTANDYNAVRNGGGDSCCHPHRTRLQTDVLGSGFLNR